MLLNCSIAGTLCTEGQSGKIYRRFAIQLFCIRLFLIVFLRIFRVEHRRCLVLGVHHTLVECTSVSYEGKEKGNFQDLVENSLSVARVGQFLNQLFIDLQDFSELPT